MNSNHISNRTCDFCDDSEETGKKLQPYDTSGRYFCSREHMIKFYESRGTTSQLAQSNSPLNKTEVETLEASLHEQYGPLSAFSKLTMDEKRLRVLELNRKLIRIRSEILAAERAINEHRIKNVSDQIEEDRKFPEARSHKQVTKLQGVLEKAIYQYVTLLGDNSGASIVSQTMGITKERVFKEIERMRNAGLLDAQRKAPSTT